MGDGMIKFDPIPTQAYWIAIAGLVALLGVQQIRVAGAHADLATARTALAQAELERGKETLARTDLALEYGKKISALQIEHATNQQKTEEKYAAKIEGLEADRTAGVATAMRLRDRIAGYAARDRRPGETDAAAGQRFADRLETVSGLLAESVDLVVEGRDIIGRRDAEVGRLLEQIQIDRLACTAPADTSGVSKP